MNANLIFNWLRDERFAPGVDVGEIEEGVFLPVAISDEPETALPAVHQATPVRDQDRPVNPLNESEFLKLALTDCEIYLITAQ